MLMNLRNRKSAIAASAPGPVLGYVARNRRWRPAMPYTMHRIFCATPGDLEPERQAFHDVVGQVNEAEGMPRNILFVPLSIVPLMSNKLIFRTAVEDNIRQCRFFIQVLQNTWGPSTRNFEPDYNLACRLKDDPASLMEGVAMFFKAANEVEPGIAELKSPFQSQPKCAAYEFATLDEYKQQLRAQLSTWLRNIEK